MSRNRLCATACVFVGMALVPLVNPVHAQWQTSSNERTGWRVERARVRAHEYRGTSSRPILTFSCDRFDELKPFFNMTIDWGTPIAPDDVRQDRSVSYQFSPSMVEWSWVWITRRGSATSITEDNDELAPDRREFVSLLGALATQRVLYARVDVPNRGSITAAFSLRGAGEALRSVAGLCGPLR